MKSSGFGLQGVSVSIQELLLLCRIEAAQSLEITERI